VSVRAQWHLADLAVDQDDDSDPMSDLLNMAKPIDLSEDRASLNERLQSLIQQEARVAEQTGVECDIKYDAGHSCLTCPQFTADPDDRMFSVCRIGGSSSRSWPARSATRRSRRSKSSPSAHARRRVRRAG
jgi:hypothetical protein